MTTVNDAATLAELGTEQADARYAHIDRMSVGELAATMNDADAEVPRAVARALPEITAAIEAIVPRLKAGGRIRYVGAGTAGRVAVVDASEAPPTYGTPPEFIQAILAGGPDALVLSTEGAEDDEAAAVTAIDDNGIGPNDVVIGIAASGTTPYTVSAIREADAAGALTIGIASNPGTPLLTAAKHAILLDTGAEVVAGSTRMKAGTAQKIALNLISTAIMIRLGRVYKGLMVNMRVSNHKLRERAIGMVDQLGGIGRAEAEAALEQAGGNIKLAVLLSRGAPLAAAEQALAEANDNLRLALARLDGTQVA